MKELAAALCEPAHCRVVGQHPTQPVLVCGGPGTGKTWACVQLAHELAKRCGEAATTDGVPLVPALLYVQRLARMLHERPEDAPIDASILVQYFARECEHQQPPRPPSLPCLALPCLLFPIPSPLPWPPRAPAPPPTRRPQPTRPPLHHVYYVYVCRALILLLAATYAALTIVRVRLAPSGAIHCGWLDFERHGPWASTGHLCLCAGLALSFWVCTHTTGHLP